MKRIPLVAAAVLAMSWAGTAMAGVNDWDWESGTFEGWSAVSGDTTLTMEQPGQDSAWSLGVVGLTTGFAQIININDAILEPVDIVDQNVDVYVDLDMAIADHPNAATLLEVWGQLNYAHWQCEPYWDMGWVEDLGDGWYRHHFEWVGSFGEYERGGPPPPPEHNYVQWNAASLDGLESPVDVRLDNFHIPEPATLSLLALGGLLVTRRRR